MIDPKTYAEITAKRPELRVQHERNPLEYRLEPVPSSPGWWIWVQYITGGGKHWYEYVSPQRAEDMIGWHWTRMLPDYHGVIHTLTGEWAVAKWHGPIVSDYCPDPLSALAEFWRQQ